MSTTAILNSIINDVAGSLGLDRDEARLLVAVALLKNKEAITSTATGVSVPRLTTTGQPANGYVRAL